MFFFSFFHAMRAYFCIAIRHGTPNAYCTQRENLFLCLRVSLSLLAGNNLNEIAQTKYKYDKQLNIYSQSFIFAQQNRPLSWNLCKSAGGSVASLVHFGLVLMMSFVVVFFCSLCFSFFHSLTVGVSLFCSLS